MSIDVLVSGRLLGAPALRKASDGSRYVWFRVAAFDKAGESLLCGCITSSQSAMRSVLALSDGNGIAVSGEAALSHWQDDTGAMRYGLDVAVHAVLTTCHAGCEFNAALASSPDTGGGL